MHHKAVALRSRLPKATCSQQSKVEGIPGNKHPQDERQEQLCVQLVQLSQQHHGHKQQNKNFKGDDRKFSNMQKNIPNNLLHILRQSSNVLHSIPQRLLICYWYLEDIVLLLVDLMTSDTLLCSCEAMVGFLSHCTLQQQQPFYEMD